ncbi:MAG: glycosyltransferase [Clostridia bacterium]|nr:glycosyltransferase [Clostridia bacterium]
MLSYLKKLIWGQKLPDKKPLNLYQYKFIRYKEEREKAYPLPLSKVHVPQIDDLVSVILPVYNGGDILADSIESVLEQTYENFELIIINDGSKDKTLEIAQEYAKRDKRIKVLTQENKKIPRTLSRGFNEARGEFLTWTSADNVMDRDFLEKLVEDLRSKPDVGMIYGNMRLIDARGKRLRKHGWYEFPFGSGNVIFPNNTCELNTYANNTIGAAFMYRKSAKEILGCYSSYKHTLEDYDYWMRMNCLCGIEHTDFLEPVYSYRWHDGSLTAKDKELGITKSRYKLMVLDDFRRDFYLMPLLWYVKATPEYEELAESFKAELRRAGHVILVKEDFPQLFFGEAASNLCYISFGGERADVTLPADTIKIGLGAPNHNENGFDILCSIGEKAIMGWEKPEYVFEDVATMFSFIDAKAKNDMLYNLEGIIERTEEFEKKLSVILCTHKMTDTLKDCLDAICNQTANKKDYELVFVNNSFRDDNLKELVQDFKKEYPELDINYITAPLKGLSFARNMGLWAARGEYVLYVDDDAIMDSQVVLETIRSFDGDLELGVVGGKVELTIPDDAKNLVTKNTIGLWSDLSIDGDDIKYAKDYGDFPYGANFGVRTSELRRIGGFRTGYGRVGNNFAGGEETLVCFMMDTIHKKVALNPRSRVEHRIAEDRFNTEHIEKTVYSGVMTQYRLRLDLYAPQDWNDMNVRERMLRGERLAKIEKEGSADYIFHKSTAKAFEDVLNLRQKDYEYMVKNKV